jgi:hypothetical protein
MLWPKTPNHELPLESLLYLQCIIVAQTNHFQMFCVSVPFNFSNTLCPESLSHARYSTGNQSLCQDDRDSVVIVTNTTIALHTCLEENIDGNYPHPSSLIPHISFTIALHTCLEENIDGNYPPSLIPHPSYLIHHCTPYVSRGEY